MFPPRRLAPVLLAVLAAVALAAVGQHLWRGALSAGAITGRAEWIWAQTPERAAPLAFYAVRDVHLAELPERATLHALADPAYVLYLNGHRVGSNRHHPGASLDAYPVAPLLVTGANRLVAELRAPGGAGGFLASLTVDGAPVVVSDRSWRVVRRHRPGLVEGWAPLPGEAERPVSWGRPPVGRWGVIGGVAARPTAATAGEPCRLVQARQIDSGNTASFDFGRPVTGYLHLRFDPRAVAGTQDALGLVAVSAGEAGLPSLPVLPVAGRPEWTDVVPRTFRHVAVAGLPGPVAASVLPVAPTALATLPDPSAAPPASLAGIDPPRRPSLVDVLVRKRAAEGGTSAPSAP